MTDPFGALATQRKGDLGVFDGSGWFPSSQKSSTGAVMGLGTDPGTFFNGSYTAAYPPARVITILDGSDTSPVTEERATVKIVRTEHITTLVHGFDPGYNAGISVNVKSLTGNLEQSTAVWGQSQGYTAAGAYMLGGYFTGIHTEGTGGVGGGIFVVAQSYVPGGGAQGVASLMYNSTGNIQPYVAAGNAITGFDCYHGGTGGVTVTLPVASPGVVHWAGHNFTANAPVLFLGAGLPTGVVAGTTYYVLAAGLVAGVSFEIAATPAGAAINFTGSSTGTQTGWAVFNDGAGFQVRSDGTNRWDVGYAVLTGSTLSSGFRDDSTSAIAVDIRGDHATASIYVLNDNANHYAQKWERTTATAGLWGLLVHSTGDLHIDEPGVAQKFVFTKGTPGANSTCLFVQEGAGPTMRQLKTFNPGAAGINFTNGQLVCVLV